MNKGRVFWTAAAVFFLVGLMAWLATSPARAEQGDVVKLLKLALPSAERFTQASDVGRLKAKVGSAAEGVRAVFYGYVGERRVGFVVWTATSAYTPNEPIHTMTGLDLNGDVQNAIVFRHRETPGWVDPINNGTFQRQFAGIPAAEKLTLVVNGRPVKRGDITAIANSTISSKGVAVGVSQARKLFQASVGEMRGE